MNFRDQDQQDDQPQHFGYYGDRDDNYQKSGYGIMVFPTRATYRGHWLSDKMHGKGVYDWADGNRYEGEFQEGKQCGYGVYTWPSGGKYFGYWENDKMCGRGVYIRHDGVVYEGYWKNDHQVGWGIKRVPEQICYGNDCLMVNGKAIQEYWTEDHKVLIYFELTKKNLFRRDSFVDVVVRCHGDDSDSSCEEDDGELLLEDVDDEISEDEGIVDVAVIGDENHEEEILIKEDVLKHFSGFDKKRLRAFLQEVLRDRAKSTSSKGGAKVSREDETGMAIVRRGRPVRRRRILRMRSSKSQKLSNGVTRRRKKKKRKKRKKEVEKKPKRSPEIDPRSILNFKKFIRYLKYKQKTCKKGKKGNCSSESNGSIVKKRSLGSFRDDSKL